jgi:hypothetical protein
MGLEPTPPDRGHAPPKVRSVLGGSDHLSWLAAGWRDLRANPIASLAYGLLFAIAGDPDHDFSPGAMDIGSLSQRRAFS